MSRLSCCLVGMAILSNMWSKIYIYICSGLVGIEWMRDRCMQMTCKMVHSECSTINNYIFSSCCHQLLLIFLPPFWSKDCSVRLRSSSWSRRIICLRGCLSTKVSFCPPFNPYNKNYSSIFISTLASVIVVAILNMNTQHIFFIICTMHLQKVRLNLCKCSQMKWYNILFSIKVISFRIGNAITTCGMWIIGISSDASVYWFPQECLKSQYKLSH